MPATNCAHRWRRSSATPRRWPKMARSTRKCARRFGATIQVEARRMLRIVEDLMSLSRIEADRFSVARRAGRPGRSRADRDRTCRTACWTGAAAGSSDWRSITDLPPIAGDFGQLLQLADNLIGNAIRYGCNDKGMLGRQSSARATVAGAAGRSATRATASRRSICRG